MNGNNQPNPPRKERKNKANDSRPELSTEEKAAYNARRENYIKAIKRKPISDPVRFMGAVKNQDQRATDKFEMLKSMSLNDNVTKSRLDEIIGKKLVKKVTQIAASKGYAFSEADVRMIIAADDIGSLLSTAWSIGSQVYDVLQTRPGRDFISSILGTSSGLSQFGSSTASATLTRNLGGSYSSTGVSLNYVCAVLHYDGGLGASPSDSPNAVATSRFRTTFQLGSLTGGSSSAAIVMVKNLFGDASISAGRSSYFSTCGVSNLDLTGSGTTATGYTWANAAVNAGPITSQTAVAMKYRIIHQSIDITPVTSLNSSSGRIYSVGLYTTPNDSFSTSGSGTNCPYLPQNVRDSLPNSQLTNMYTNSSQVLFPELSEPQDDIFTVSVNGADVDTTNQYLPCFVIYATGGATGTAYCNVTINVIYEMFPTQSGNLILSAQVPAPGPLSNMFLDTIRSMVPEIVVWPPEKRLELVRALKACGSSEYDALLAVVSKFTSGYSYQPAKHHGFTAPQEVVDEDSPFDLGDGIPYQPRYSRNGYRPKVDV